MEKMNKLFEYFADADEAVCVSDAETNELIYMNCSLREILARAINDTGEVLEGYEEKLREDSFGEPENYGKLLSCGLKQWMNENPLLRQCYVIKDKLMECDGRTYCIEVAAPKIKSDLEKVEHHLTRREMVLNECLQLFFAAPDPDKSLSGLLRYLGQIFYGSRAYIFEIYEDGTATNTHEWCARGVELQCETLCGIPLSDIGYWIQIFSKENVVTIRDIEDIHQAYPTTYSLLKSRGVASMVAGPIREGEQVKGFIGVDNPDAETIFLLEQVLAELGKYMMPQFKRRDLYHRFTQMSYHDILTGAYNRNAILEHNMIGEKWRSFGAIYCDINALKDANNAQGHEAGDELIRECYRMMQKNLHTEWIYRVGGDEFIALYYDMDKHIIEKDVDALRLAILQSTCQIAIGYAWTDETPVDTEKIMDQADAEMRREKNMYYALMDADDEMEQHQTEQQVQDVGEEDEDDRQLSLRRFLSNAYCDVAFLLGVLGNENKTSYFFFGDMQQEVYYISENMRLKFGFSSNIIPDLIHVWASRIEDPDLLGRFWRDFDALLRKKQRYHDLRYQVYDANGNKIWIQCFGQVKWSEDGTTPLFFAGRISQQDEDFVVDPLTNFPTEAVLKKELEKIQAAKQPCQAIGFALHNITQINNNQGRDYGDQLICEIASKLGDVLSHQVTFFRLSGMRFLGLMEGRSIEQAEEAISEIRGIIDGVYNDMGVTIPTTCSFALLHCLEDGVAPQDFIENILSLIKVAHQSPDRMLMGDAVGNIQKIKETASMESQLMENVLNGMKNFRVVVQPVVSTKTGMPVGGETLLRWQLDGKNVPPSIFVPVIEKEKTIFTVGRWVFEQAVRACVRLTTLMPAFYLTVNVSLQQLDDEGFVAFIQATLEKYGLDGSHIVLELTESCMDSQPEKLERFVQDCSKMNIRIALDDFGSGYSSLRVLLRYSSNIIKLDRSLLLEMSDSAEKSCFITSIVYACHQFGKKVCMEGVETDFQNELVKEAGCDLIQGFYYYKPMELDAVYRLVAEQYDESKESMAVSR